MRGNGNRNQKTSHIVSAWSDENGFYPGQKVAGEKSSEITAIPQLLDAINVKENIITIDATETQTAIAEKIKSKKADYVLSVKENQKNLYAEISEYFEDEEFLKEIKNGAGYKKTQEKSHSRTEIREYYQSDKIKWMEEKSRWKGLKSIEMVCKTIINMEKTVTEKRYYISSLPLEIEFFSRSVCQHWSAEIMHWHLDITFKEDANTT